MGLPGLTAIATLVGVSLTAVKFGWQHRRPTLHVLRSGLRPGRKWINCKLRGKCAEKALATSPRVYDSGRWIGGDTLWKCPDCGRTRITEWPLRCDTANAGH